MKSELTPTQWRLYNFLKERGDSWTTQKDIAHALKDCYDVSSDSTNFHDCKARQQMTVDIRKINESNVIQKVIISSPKGVKIANEEEFSRYIRKELNAAVRKLLRAKQKLKKGELNGQYKITFGNHERNIIEAFLENDKGVANVRMVD